MSTPEGSSAAGTIVSVGNIDGALMPAHLLQENLYLAQNVGQKLILEVVHPEFGNVKLVGQLSERNDTAAVIYYGIQHAELVVPQLPPGPTSNRAPQGGGIAGGGCSTCCSAQGTPGCDDPDCQAIVCAVDPFCCDVAWDGICAGEAETMCGDLCPCGGGGCGNCESPSGVPGCSDPVCEGIVCAVDPFCCDVAWDSICAGEATSLCDCGGGGGGGNDNCAGALPIFDGNTPFSNVGATSDGPSPCGLMGSDIWYNYTATCTGTVTLNTCGSGYDTVVAAYNGCACPVGAPLACNDDFCGLQTQITFPVTAGNCYKIQVGGFNGAQGSGTISITCGGGGGDCPGAPPACGPDAGGCFIADGTPGCDDCDCCAAVCSIDPFCCDVAWDGICVGETASFPVECGGTPCDSCLTCPPGSLPEDEPCGSDTNGGCNAIPPAFTDAACDQTWCGNAWATGGTRDTDWYLVNHGGGPISGTVVSELPTVCFIVDGIGACAPVVVGDIGCSDACANIAPASADLPAGQYVVFVAAGDCGGGGIFEGFPCGDCNDYTLSIDCIVPPLGACCLPDGSCVPDTFEEDCVAAPSDGCGNCNQASGVPGCSDPECQAIVCGVDPFCCDVAWDGICAAEAADLCDCTQGGLGGVWYEGLPCDEACVPQGACCQCNGLEQFCTIEEPAVCAELGGQYLGDGTSCEAAGEAATFDSGPIAVPIPDNSTGSHTIAVGPSFSVVDVNVQLSLTHTWVGDLCVTLTHGATTIEIIRRPGLSPDTCGPGSCCGCSADNYAGIILDDEGGGGAIESACSSNLTSPPGYTPNDALDAFDGADSAGNWTLTVSDGAGGDTGTLTNWKLILTQPAVGTPCAAAYPEQCVPTNNPPDCSGASPSVGQLWPPNHVYHSITVEGVTDPDGDPVTITITGIYQDEVLNGTGDGNTCPDGQGVGTSTAQVRAERSGLLDGRVYHISFVADDGQGGSCEGTVTVCVPHDQDGGTCVDQGPLYDSTSCVSVLWAPNDEPAPEFKKDTAAPAAE